MSRRTEREKCELIMNDFFVYILRCSDGSYYIGHTDNIEERISAHKTGYFGGYTKNRLPIEVVFVQSFGTRDEAFTAERQMMVRDAAYTAPHHERGWSRAKKEAVIRGDWNRITKLAKSHRTRKISR